MSAASAAGQAVAQRIGHQAGMDAWRDGGPARAEMQVAGAAVVAGLEGWRKNGGGGRSGCWRGLTRSG